MRSGKRGWAWAVGIALAFALLSLPGLTWRGFVGGAESLNVETALEIRRGGPWWVPNLNGQPRLIKPPLTAWVTAAFIRDSTMRGLDEVDRARREAAYRALAWDVRWPAVAETSLALLGCFAIGRLLVGARAGIAGMAMFGSSLMVSRFGRQATTDVMLLLWVTWANATLLHLVRTCSGGNKRDRSSWGWALASGACLGLAFLSKGPVALVETVLPVGIVSLFWGGAEWRRLAARAALVLGTFALVATPWFADQLRTHGGELWTLWLQEVRRDSAINDRPRDPIWAYLNLWPMMLPWVLQLTAGLVLARRDKALLKLAALTLAPLVVMSCFKDKNERYVLPMAVPAALMAGAVATRAGLPSWARGCRDGGNLLAYAAACGVAALGAAGWPGLFETAEGTPWHSKVVATAVCAACVGLGGLAWRGRKWWAPAPALCAASAALAADTLFVHGYVRTEPGMPETRAIAWEVRERHPGATVYEYLDSDARFGAELRIYLNRVIRGVRPGEERPGEGALLLQVRPADKGFPAAPAGFREAEEATTGKRKARVLAPATHS